MLEWNQTWSGCLACGIFFFFILIGGCVAMTSGKLGCPPTDPYDFNVPFFSAVGGVEIVAIILTAIITIKKKNYLNENLKAEALKVFLKDIKVRNQEILRSGATYSSSSLSDSERERLTKTIIADE